MRRMYGAMVWMYDNGGGCVYGIRRTLLTVVETSSKHGIVSSNKTSDSSNTVHTWPVSSHGFLFFLFFSFVAFSLSLFLLFRSFFSLFYSQHFTYESDYGSKQSVVYRNMNVNANGGCCCLGVSSHKNSFHLGNSLGRLARYPPKQKYSNKMTQEQGTTQQTCK